MSNKFDWIFYRVFEWYDQDDSLDIIHLALNKALDKVPQKRLIKNRRVMGFRGMS